MTAYRPCHNCRVNREECATLHKMKLALVGLRVTSVKFNCPDRAPLYRAGDRVSVTWPVPDDPEDFGPYMPESWPATVIEEKGAKFIICVDDVRSDNDTPARDYIQNPNLYAKVSALKLAPLDEPKRSVCGVCGLVAGNDLSGCWSAGIVPHRGCLRSEMEAKA